MAENFFFFVRLLQRTIQYNTIFFYCSRRQTAAKVTYTMTCRPMFVMLMKDLQSYVFKALQESSAAANDYHKFIHKMNGDS